MVWGAPAGGKTALCRDLVAACPVPLLHLASDAVRQAIVGARYVIEVREVVYDGLRAMAARALADDLPVLLDANYLDVTHRQAVRAMASAAGSRMLSVLVEADLEVRLSRNRGRADADRVPEDHLRKAHRRALDARPDADLIVEGRPDAAVAEIVAWIYRDEVTGVAPIA